MSSWPRWNRSPRDCSPLKTSRRSQQNGAELTFASVGPDTSFHQDFCGVRWNRTIDLSIIRTASTPTVQAL
jgi:hypothetical protein